MIKLWLIYNLVYNSILIKVIYKIHQLIVFPALHHNIIWVRSKTRIYFTQVNANVPIYNCLLPAAGIVGEWIYIQGTIPAIFNWSSLTHTSAVSEYKFSTSNRNRQKLISVSRLVALVFNCRWCDVIHVSKLRKINLHRYKYDLYLNWNHMQKFYYFNVSLNNYVVDSQIIYFISIIIWYLKNLIEFVF